MITLFLILKILAFSYAPNSQVLLGEENRALLDNPDRGIYVQVSTAKANTMFDYELLDGIDNLRVVLLTLDLGEYKDREYLDERKLKELDQALCIAEEAHFSVVFRAAYNFNGKNFKDPEEFSYILNHVRQISEVLGEHKDCIMCVQAGMLGPYGEWHSSKYLKEPYTQEAHEVLMEWLSSLPEDICVALRRPSFVRAAISMGADADRLTVHNDALLSTDTDMGTFQDKDYTREAELTYIGECTPAHMGGEMTNLSKYTEPDEAVSEFDEMGISYLNRYYNEKVWNAWKKQEYGEWSADEYIIAHLGYRLVLKKATVTEYLGRKQFEIEIENTGFGKLDERVSFYLYVKDGGREGYILFRDVEREEGKYCLQCTLWDPDGEEDAIGIVATRFPIAGTDRSYFIELANDEMEYSNGINLFPARFSCNYLRNLINYMRKQ